MKKALSILLVLLMAAAVLPLGVFAADPVAVDSNNVYYDILKDAFDNAANGATITLLDNIETAYTHNIGSETDQTRELTLNLNGHTITGIDSRDSGNYEIFYNFGTFTVIDSVGGGRITLKAQYNRNWSALSAIFHNRGGVLNIYGGTFEHLGGTNMAYAVDNSANSFGDAVTNIYGGTLSSTYVGIRNRMDDQTHSGNGDAIVNVYGGSISGASRSIWGQVSSTSASAPASGSITITDGTLNGKIYIDDDKNSSGDLLPRDTDLSISGGTINGDVITKEDELEITGGEFSGSVTLYDDKAEPVESGEAISGGTFTNPAFDPTPYLAADKTVDPSTGAVVQVHRHVPKVEWEMDAAAHWHRCQTCNEICTEFGAHSDVRKDGYCDDCGWYFPKTATTGRQNPSTGVKA